MAGLLMKEMIARRATRHAAAGRQPEIAVVQSQLAQRVAQATGVDDYVMRRAVIPVR